ncbi:MAG: undecaprenyl-diphosphate phosphatase [Verrucomicrobia bacterium]|nr:undecaprenyl-diphosphate phosphatase [Verrucomicrobiota bacterium]
MSHLLALLLGVVQGMTEFFPISSSAHLKLTKMLFGVEEMPVIFDLACHLGSLLALVWFFKREIVKLIVEDRKGMLYLFLALIPLVPSYFLLGSLRKIASEPQFLGFCLMITGAILLLGQKIRVKSPGRPVRDALLIGTMQSAALIPGISRSASTISCASALGWAPKDAVRFSFLLAIPTIVGGNLVETLRLWKDQETIQLNLDCLIGFGAAFIAGIIVIRFAIAWLEKGNLKHFAWYCILLGMIASFFLWS